MAVAVGSRVALGQQMLHAPIDEKTDFRVLESDAVDRSFVDACWRQPICASANELHDKQPNACRRLDKCLADASAVYHRTLKYSRAEL